MTEAAGHWIKFSGPDDPESCSTSLLLQSSGLVIQEDSQFTVEKWDQTVRPKQWCNQRNYRVEEIQTLRSGLSLDNEYAEARETSTLQRECPHHSRLSINCQCYYQVDRALTSSSLCKGRMANQGIISNCFLIDTLEKSVYSPDVNSHLQPLLSG